MSSDAGSVGREPGWVLQGGAGGAGAAAGAASTSDDCRDDAVLPPQYLGVSGSDR